MVSWLEKVMLVMKADIIPALSAIDSDSPDCHSESDEVGTCA
jgi:hypothetical protein